MAIHNPTNGAAMATKPATVREIPQTMVQQMHHQLLSMDGVVSGTADALRKYDPAKFIIPASDAQGHNDRAQCRVPPEIPRQAQVIIASHKFPFRTPGDLYRWAIYVGLKLLDVMEPTPNTFMARMEAANMIIRETIYLQEYQETIRSLDVTVNQLISSGSTGQARKLVAQVRAQFSKIEEEHWSRKLVEMVDQKFGHIMNAGGTAGVSLIGQEEG